jgi:molybdopterin/thiamine biosynthesis adenylyltransferase
VGIVGGGGLGCLVAQALINLGIRRSVVIDDDTLTESNRNRWVLGFPADIGAYKVDLIRRYMLMVDPTAEVIAIPENLRSRTALSELMKCTTIFGCVDNDGARLILTELCVAYGITYIDCASEIIPQKPASPLDFGGRVVVCRPGQFCLFCAGELDSEEAKMALEDPLVRAARAAHGYGLGSEVESPSVVSLNGVVANLAVTEFMVMITRLREPALKLTYRGMRGVVLSGQVERSPSCYTCGVLAGIRDEVDIFRYVNEGRNNEFVATPPTAA